MIVNHSNRIPFSKDYSISSVSRSNNSRNSQKQLKSMNTKPESSIKLGNSDINEDYGN